MRDGYFPQWLKTNLISSCYLGRIVKLVDGPLNGPAFAVPQEGVSVSKVSVATGTVFIRQEPDIEPDPTWQFPES